MNTFRFLSKRHTPVENLERLATFRSDVAGQVVSLSKRQWAVSLMLLAELRRSLTAKNCDRLGKRSHLFMCYGPVDVNQQLMADSKNRGG